MPAHPTTATHAPTSKQATAMPNKAAAPSIFTKAYAAAIYAARKASTPSTVRA